MNMGRKLSITLNFSREVSDSELEQIKHVLVVDQGVEKKMEDIFRGFDSGIKCVVE